MTDAREKAIEAAINAFYEHVVTIDSDDDLGMKDAISSYERAMLEAGWKMCPRQETDAMLDAKYPDGIGPTKFSRIWRMAWDAVK